VTVQADFELSTHLPDQTSNEGAVADEKPACVALVPVIPAAHWSGVPDQLRSRADFVTQLIATAEHVPQTRSLRRGTSADAKAAYRASLHRAPLAGAGIRTRQIV
jgi:hypothetical protein